MRLRWSIKVKLAFCLGIFVLTLLALGFSSFRGPYAYRELAKSIRDRSLELPRAVQLSKSVASMRVSLAKVRQRSEMGGFVIGQPVDLQILREEFQTHLLEAKDSLRQYRQQLRPRVEAEGSHIYDTRQEWETVGRMEATLKRIDELNRREAWMHDDVKVIAIEEELDQLYSLSSELPGYLQRTMYDLQVEVRTQYRTWIITAWTASIVAAIALPSLLALIAVGVLKPLQQLMEGSRKVPESDFQYVIPVKGDDEIAELARALNDMTQRFREIRDDLDQKVKLRTKEVVRSEQLASVGFLAAGVAHEINNPLASIAMCAESLEYRLHDILSMIESDPSPEAEEEIQQLKKYLQTIQSEAFRCKGITERLLDYSRLGDVTKHRTNLLEIVEGTLEMVRHLGKYRGKRVELRADGGVAAMANAQEMKQVLLNLVTNALDSTDDDGIVVVSLSQQESHAIIRVEDNGCGMTDEVLQHLFEPFFTRRKEGQGTGLGLSITYRIVSEHGGNIEVNSEGPGKGSQFIVRLPQAENESGNAKLQAA